MADIHVPVFPAGESYFRLIARRARLASEEGNYAIAAALVLREDGREAVFEGWNTVFAPGDPSGHAEMNAIRLAHAVATLPDDASLALVKQARRHRAIHTRAVMDDRREHILFTTLEPCPMCTVCLINAGIDRVIIGAADPASGTLDASRLDRLPPLWSELAKAIGLTASFCQSEKPEEAETYLPRELHDELLDMFTASRKELDEELGNTGVLDFAKAIANGWAAINGNSRADSKYS